jgi:hypothetical protein
MERKRLRFLPGAFLVASVFTAAIGKGDTANDSPVVPHLSSPPTISASTVPLNGDLNPYGVFFVPGEFPSGGPLHAGDVVVSNFNNGGNFQGTGTTIVAISPTGRNTLFFQGTTAGLSTALGVLKAGFVIVGNVPSTNGSGVCTQVGNQEQDVGRGSLTILNRNGKVVNTLKSARLLDGPWDLALLDGGNQAAVFISDVLSGTVTRLDLAVRGDSVVVEQETQIASGYTHRCDPAAFVVGPTGLAFDSNTDTLYVTSTADNEIFAINNASVAQTDRGTGTVFIQDTAHLHGPLGLVLAPNGDLISTQGDAVNPDPKHPSEIVEYTPQGKFVAQFSIDPAAGSAFGLAVIPFGEGFRFAAVDDGLNLLDIWDVR